MEINLNQVAKIKLTTLGIEVLKDKHYEFQMIMSQHNPNHVTKPFLLNLDDEGWYRDQLWCIMRDFGNYVNIGTIQPFDATIIVEE